jgi:hypothetical protein
MRKNYKRQYRFDSISLLVIITLFFILIKWFERHFFETDEVYLRSLSSRFTEKRISKLIDTKNNSYLFIITTPCIYLFKAFFCLFR